MSNIFHNWEKFNYLNIGNFNIFTNQNFKNISIFIFIKINHKILGIFPANPVLKLPIFK